MKKNGVAQSHYSLIGNRTLAMILLLALIVDMAKKEVARRRFRAR